VSLAATLWATGVAMRVRSIQGGPAMQIPVFLVLFLAPVYVPLGLLTGWIHAVASVNPATALLEAGRSLIAGDPVHVALASTAALPFDHLVVIMMENHSFDNLLGALKHSGQPLARGLRFDTAGVAVNSNPGPDGRVRSFPFPSTAQGEHVSQSWNATHQQIDGGRMDGFVRSVEDVQPMGYWTEEVLPFAYSLARTFCLANRR